MGATGSSLTAAGSAGAQVAVAARALKRVASCLFPVLIGGVACLFVLLSLGCVDLGIHKYWKGLGVGVVAALLCALGIFGLAQLWHALSFTLPLLELAGVPQRELEEKLQQYEGWAEAHTPKPRPHYRHEGTSRSTQQAGAPSNSAVVPAGPQQVLQHATSSLKEQVNKTATHAQDQLQQTVADGQHRLQEAAQQANSLQEQVSKTVTQGQEQMQQAVADGQHRLQEAAQQANSLQEQANRTVMHAQEQMQQAVADGQHRLQETAQQADSAVCNVRDQTRLALHQTADDAGSYLTLVEMAVLKAADVILSQIDHALLLYPLLFTLAIVGLAIAAGQNKSSVPESLIAVMTVLAVLVSIAFCFLLLSVCCCVRPLLSTTISSLLHHYIVELKEIIEKGERSAEGCANTLASHVTQPLRA
eukprot:TRINITY_DN4987_c0_g1_i1.p1 TRINITY_DN4987_c0_g1~~TRINITY_DN4987_c0_g1_i1.p1  ORF type:complete len:418 (+),score=85.07 TRINITY_DN4987_c0_g1_i1:67-1320(+)